MLKIKHHIIQQVDIMRGVTNVTLTGRMVTTVVPTIQVTMVTMQVTMVTMQVAMVTKGQVMITTREMVRTSYFNVMKNCQVVFWTSGELHVLLTTLDQHYLVF